MLDMQSGHMGCGQWHLKEDDEGIPYLSHKLPFGARDEFRIGPQDIEKIEIQNENSEKIQIRIMFTDDRYGIATIDKPDLGTLLNMASRDEPAPEKISTDNWWKQGLIIFVIVCLVFQFAR
ncbi:hypothetical protein [Bermanella sp. R86510]|uniref:hypothetical protein n=1 Tax=unclassified Bermanella TaxID=2627862 RepID=UPI0037CBB84E